MLFGGLGGQVVGASAYAQIDGAWYLEVGGYRSLSPSFLRKVNADFGGRLSGVAPYARASLERMKLLLLAEVDVPDEPPPPEPVTKPSSRKRSVARPRAAPASTAQSTTPDSGG